MTETVAAKRHRAFISYSHHADHRLAPALQDALQELAKPLFATRAINVASPATLLIVLTEGSITFDETKRDFAWEKTMALPPNLRGVWSRATST